MTREEAKELLPIIQAYVYDKRDVTKKGLEDKADEQPCVTIDDIVKQIEAEKNVIEKSLMKAAIVPQNNKTIER